MISKLSQSGHTSYGLIEYVLDNESDMDDLPVDSPIGSTAFVISTTSSYMINSKGEWIKMNTTNTSSSTSTNSIKISSENNSTEIIIDEQNGIIYSVVGGKKQIVANKIEPISDEDIEKLF